MLIVWSLIKISDWKWQDITKISNPKSKEMTKQGTTLSRNLGDKRDLVDFSPINSRMKKPLMTIIICCKGPSSLKNFCNVISNSKWYISLTMNKQGLKTMISQNLVVVIVRHIFNTIKSNLFFHAEHILFCFLVTEFSCYLSLLPLKYAQLLK